MEDLQNTDWAAQTTWNVLFSFVVFTQNPRPAIETPNAVYQIAKIWYRKFQLPWFGRINWNNMAHGKMGVAQPKNEKKKKKVYRFRAHIFGHMLLRMECYRCLLPSCSSINGTTSSSSSDGGFGSALTGYVFFSVSRVVHSPKCSHTNSSFTGRIHTFDCALIAFRWSCVVESHQLNCN